MRPDLHDYLAALQEATVWTGLSEFCQANRHRVPHERTVRRWHKQHGDTFVVSPVFAVEGLGLTHLHAFLISPEEIWETFPYVVESAWVTTDGLSEVLYVHCVAPVEHLGAVRRQLRNMARGVEFIESCTGWERTRPQAHEVSHKAHRWDYSNGELLRSSPFVVPAVFEAWGQMLSLDAIWKKTKTRLGSSLRQYFPGQRYYPTNGKLHVKEAFESLSAARLFCQFAVRQAQANNVEAFVLMDPACTETFLPSVHKECSMIATHPSEEGCLLRLAGTPRLFESLLNCERRIYWVNRTATAEKSRVRFAYESLFAPTSGTWVLPEDAP